MEEIDTNITYKLTKISGDIIEINIKNELDKRCNSFCTLIYELRRKDLYFSLVYDNEIIYNDIYNLSFSLNCLEYLEYKNNCKINNFTIIYHNKKIQTETYTNYKDDLYNTCYYIKINVNYIKNIIEKYTFDYSILSKYIIFPNILLNVKYFYIIYKYNNYIPKITLNYNYGNDNKRKHYYIKSLFDLYINVTYIKSIETYNLDYLIFLKLFKCELKNIIFQYQAKFIRYILSEFYYDIITEPYIKIFYNKKNNVNNNVKYNFNEFIKIMNLSFLNIDNLLLYNNNNNLDFGILYFYDYYKNNNSIPDIIIHNFDYINSNKLFLYFFTIEKKLKYDTYNNYYLTFLNELKLKIVKKLHEFNNYDELFIKYVLKNSSDTNILAYFNLYYNYHVKSFYDSIIIKKLNYDKLSIDNILYLLSSYPKIYRYLSEKFKYNECIILQAISNCGYNIKYVPLNMITEKLCILAIKKNCDIYVNLPDKYKKNINVIIELIKTNLTKIKYVPDNILSEDIIIKLIQIEYIDIYKIYDYHKTNIFYMISIYKFLNNKFKCNIKIIDCFMKRYNNLDYILYYLPDNRKLKDIIINKYIIQ